MIKLIGIILSSIILLGCGAKTTKTEDIRGIQFGAPITTIANLDDYKVGLEAKGVTLYQLKEYTNDFEQNIGFGVYEGNIEMISLTGMNNAIDYGAFNALITDMTQRWGKPIDDKVSKKGRGQSRHVTFEPKNKAVERVIISYTSDGNNVYMHETYSTKRVSLMKIN